LPRAIGAQPIGIPTTFQMPDAGHVSPVLDNAPKEILRLAENPRVDGHFLLVIFTFNKVLIKIALVRSGPLIKVSLFKSRLDVFHLGGFLF